MSRIYLEDLADEVLQFASLGSLAAGVNKALATVPFTGYLSHVKAKVETAGTKPGDATTNVVLDLNKNGTSLFGGTFCSFNGSSTSPSSYDAAVTGEIAVAAGDQLRLDIDTIFNGTSPVQPTNLTVAVVVKRFPARGIITGVIDHKVI